MKDFVSLRRWAAFLGFVTLTCRADDLSTAWARFKTATNSGAQLQEGCNPEWIRPASGAPVRGGVVIYHGFTACPQQERELGQRLAQQGYYVFLVTLPGHGRVAQADGKDDLTAMPTLDNWRNVYFPYVHAVNDLMKRVPGERITSGVSVGGELSMLSMLEAPDLYNKALFFSPFFGLSKAVRPGQKLPPILAQADTAKRQLLDKQLKNLKDGLVKAIALSPLKNMRWSWGEGCEVNERKKGRAGIYQFTPTMIAANEDLGGYIEKNLKKLPARIQFLGVEQDQAADSVATARVRQKLQTLGSDKISLCFFNAKVNHSLLSRYDSPEENKFWVDGLLKDAAAFVKDGTAIPTEHAGHTSEGQDYCRVGTPDAQPGSEH